MPLKYCHASRVRTLRPSIWNLCDAPIGEPGDYVIESAFVTRQLANPDRQGSFT